MLLMAFAILPRRLDCAALQEEARPGDAAEVWADPQMVEEWLGWKARYTDVTEGLKHAWEWRKAHPNGY